MTNAAPRRRALPTLAFLALVPLAIPARGEPPYPTMGRIERSDARFDRLIPKDAVIEQLAKGFIWAEGPVWIPKGDYLLFSDTRQNTVFQWSESGGVRSFLKPSGYTGQTPREGEPGSNGLILDPAGNLVLCQHGDRRIARLEEGGRFTTLVDRYMGKRLNSPNDGVYRSNGDLYFTDPSYGLLKLNDDPAKELPFNGVYRLAKSGELTLLTKELTFPNGIAFSPDEKTLYVANSDPNRAVWTAYPVQEDGTLGAGRVFADATPMVKTKKGLPDGLKVDKDGNLFAAGPGGILVFAPDGTHLGTLDTTVPTGNCAWGDDGTVLYITADTNLCRVKTSTRGKGH